MIFPFKNRVHVLAMPPNTKMENRVKSVPWDTRSILYVWKRLEQQAFKRIVSFQAKTLSFYNIGTTIIDISKYIYIYYNGYSHHTKYMEGASRIAHRYTLAPELPRLGLNLDPAFNHHRGVSQAGCLINVCAVPRMDVNLGIPSAGISWWTLKIPRCPSRRVSELLQASWMIIPKFLP